MRFFSFFSGTICLERIMKMKLRENCFTQVAAPNKIPLIFHNKLKKEINSTVEVGITKVNRMGKQHGCSSFAENSENSP